MLDIPFLACVHCGENFRAERSTARYCSARCRVAAQRHVVTLTPKKAASGTTLPEAGSSPKTDPNFSIKSKARVTLIPQNQDSLENPVLSWCAVNDVTFKLTDGVLIREPVSGLLGSVSAPRCLAWLTRDHMAEGYRTWVARIGAWSFGPTTVARAKAAAEARLRGEWFEPDRESGERVRELESA